MKVNNENEDKETKTIARKGNIVKNKCGRPRCISRRKTKKRELTEMKRSHQQMQERKGYEAGGLKGEAGRGTVRSKG